MACCEGTAGARGERGEAGGEGPAGPPGDKGARGKRGKRVTAAGRASLWSLSTALLTCPLALHLQSCDRPLVSAVLFGNCYKFFSNGKREIS